MILLQTLKKIPLHKCCFPSSLNVLDCIKEGELMRLSPENKLSKTDIMISLVAWKKNQQPLPKTGVHL